MLQCDTCFLHISVKETYSFNPESYDRSSTECNLQHMFLEVMVCMKCSHLGATFDLPYGEYFHVRTHTHTTNTLFTTGFDFPVLMN